MWWGFCDEGAIICDEFLSVCFQYCGGCVEYRCQYMVSILEHLGRIIGVYVGDGEWVAWSIFAYLCNRIIIAMANSDSNLRVEMVELGRVYRRYEEELRGAVEGVAASGRYIRWENVRALEEEMAEYVGVGHAVGCGNGTDALTLAFMALGLGRGDEVIVPTMTFVATAEAARSLGIDVVFADIDPRSYTLDARDVERKITGRTRAIVPVHLYGRMADMEGIMAVAERRGLYVVEDGAQAFGASQVVGGVRRRACGVGTIGCTSFFPTKNLGCMGDGGAVFTDSEEIAERVRMLGSHGARRKYYSEVVGRNSRLDEVQAAVLRVKLRHLEEMLSRRRSVALAYRKGLMGNDFYVLPEFSDGHSFNQFTIRVNYGCRDDVRRYMESRGVASMVYYPELVHRQKVFGQGGELGLVESERACGEVLSLPIHSEMTEGEVSRVVEVLNGWRIGAK